MSIYDTIFFDVYNLDHKIIATDKKEISKMYKIYYSKYDNIPKLYQLAVIEGEGKSLFYWHEV